MAEKSVITSPKPKTMSKRVILIDDSPADNVKHEKIIRDTFYEADISIIDNREEAVRFLSRELSNENERGNKVIIIDERNQGISGLDVLDELKEQLNLDAENIEIYFLTNDNSKHLVERANTYSRVKKVIQKPLTPEAANDILRNQNY